MAPKQLPFRVAAPERSKPSQSKNYRAYKPQLREDFRKRCGYCDGPDTYVGGQGGSHIDHFAPRSKFPGLENSYENLVYACPFCNRAKSDKWIGDDPAVPNDGDSGFVDPCGPELDQHLGRSTGGRVVGVTGLGRYLVNNLNLRLARHQFIWQLGRIEMLRQKLDGLRQRLPMSSDLRRELTEEISDLFAEYVKYSHAVHEQ